MLLDPNETANWIPYVIPLGPTTESHIIRYLFPERSLGRVPVDLAFATTMHLPFNESIFPENSGICALLFYAVDHPCILAAVSNIQFGSIACTEYSNHYSISVSHYNSFSIYRNSFSTHSNIFDDRESELYVSFISKRSNVSVWERVTILLSLNFDPLAPRCFICFRGNIYTAIIGRTCYSCKPFVTSIKVWKVQYYTIITRRIFGICSIRSNF